MIRVCFILFLFISTLAKAGYTPQFKAIFDQVYISLGQRNVEKASILLEKSKPKTKADSGLYLYAKGLVMNILQRPDSAIVCYNKAIQYLKETNNLNDAARAYNDLGNQYMSQVKMIKAVESFQFSVNLFEETGDTSASAGALHNIGRIHSLQGDSTRALQYTRRAITQNKLANNNHWLVRNYNQMASVFSQNNNKDSSIKYCKLELNLARQLGDRSEEALALQMFGVVYGTLNDLKLARKYFDSALSIRLETNDTIQLLNSYGALGEVCMLENNLVDAKKYMAKALQISRKIDNVKNIMNCAEILFEIAEKEKNYKDMYTYYRLQRTLDDSLHNQQLSKQLLEKEYQFNFEKKESQLKAENEKKFIRAEEEKKKQRMILLFVGLGLLAMLVFAVILYGRLKLIRKQNKLIEAQKKLVEEKQKQTELQKDVIVAKQKEIVDSIRYAQRIQNALIASDVYIARVLKQLNDPQRRRKQ